MKAILRIAVVVVWAISASQARGEPLGSEFTFQGQLKRSNLEVDGLTDMRFTLYDAAVGGLAVGSTIVFDGQPGGQPSVDVVRGFFTASLDFGSAVFDGDARWLEIEVRGHDPADMDPYSVLSPRQQVTAAPYALQTRGLFVDDVGNVGIGTTTPAAALDVNGTITATALVGDGSGLINLPVSDAVWQSDGTDAFYTAGSVGIGTSGPVLLRGRVSVMPATFPTGRSSLSAAADPITGKIYCFGGHDGTLLNEIVEYNPATDSVTLMSATLPTGRQLMAAAADPTTGKIYCFGGSDGGFPYLNEIVQYDPTTDSVTVMAATLPMGTFGLAAATDPTTGKIYCIGGFSHTGTTPIYLDTILEYDPVLDILTQKSATLPTGRYLLAAAASPSTGKIYCFGGRTVVESPLDEIIEYDPTTDSVMIMSATLPTARSKLSAALDPATGSVYFFGGRSADNLWIDEIVEYDPTTDSVIEVTARLPTGRHSLATATDQATGNIYCFGGAPPGDPVDEIVEFAPHSQSLLLQVGDPGDDTAAFSNSWGVFSSRDFKRDIEALASSDYQTILAKLNATDVVNYHCANDALRTPRLGVIAEDSPKEILGPDGKSVSLSDFNAFLMAAIKAQQAEIEERDTRIDNMESRLNRLEGSKEPSRSNAIGFTRWDDRMAIWALLILATVALVVKAFRFRNHRSNRTWVFLMLAILVSGLTVTAATGQQFSLNWHTIDGGGFVASTGGEFEMSAASGQPDAGVVLTGGEYQLIGGFWAGDGPVCACISDLNDDGIRDGDDIQKFVDCLTAAAPGCTCADVWTDGFLDMVDIDQFIVSLLSGVPCP